MINNFIVMGRLTHDPCEKITQTQNGNTICNFTIANKKRTATDSANFFNCRAWNKQAEFISNHFKKGDRILLTCSVELESFTNSEQKKQTVCVLNVQNADFVELKTQN